MLLTGLRAFKKQIIIYFPVTRTDRWGTTDDLATSSLPPASGVPVTKSKNLSKGGGPEACALGFLFKPTITMVQSGTYLDIIISGLKFQLGFLKLQTAY